MKLQTKRTVTAFTDSLDGRKALDLLCEINPRAVVHCSDKLEKLYPDLAQDSKVEPRSKREEYQLQRPPVEAQLILLNNELKDGKFNPNLFEITIAELADGTRVQVDGGNRTVTLALSGITDEIEALVKIIPVKDLQALRRLYNQIDLIRQRNMIDATRSSDLPDLLDMKKRDIADYVYSAGYADEFPAEKRNTHLSREDQQNKVKVFKDEILLFESLVLSQKDEDHRKKAIKRHALIGAALYLLRNCQDQSKSLAFLEDAFLGKSFNTAGRSLYDHWTIKTSTSGGANRYRRKLPKAQIYRGGDIKAFIFYWNNFCRGKNVPYTKPEKIPFQTVMEFCPKYKPSKQALPKSQKVSLGRPRTKLAVPKVKHVSKVKSGTVVKHPTGVLVVTP